MAKTFRISSIGFGWLGQAFSDKNSISPLTLLKKEAVGFNDQTKEELISQNIIGQDGTVNSEILPALQVLVNAEAYTRIRILGTSAPVDKVTYFKEGMSCSVDSNEGDFTVTYPAMSAEAGYVLEEFTGSSRLVNVPFHIELSQEEAMVFTSLVDLTRANSLCTLGGKPGEVIFSLHDIEKQIEEKTTYLWIMKTLKHVIGDKTIPEEHVRSALTELIKANLVIETEKGYSLYLTALELANSMLIPEYVFHITSARMISVTEAEQSDCYVVFCGMHDLLYIDKEKNGVTIETMSGSDLFSILYQTLTTPL